MHYRVEPGLYAVGRPTPDSIADAIRMVAVDTEDDLRRVEEVLVSLGLASRADLLMRISTLESELRNLMRALESGREGAEEGLREAVRAAEEAIREAGPRMGHLTLRLRRLTRRARSALGG